jgi:hypothetical protein
MQYAEPRIAGTGPAMAGGAGNGAMTLSELYTGGLIADIVVAVLALEAVVLAFFVRRSPAFPQLLAGLAAGLCLVLALRAALTNSGWQSLAVFLTLSFLAHAIELRLAFRPR